MNCPCEGKTKRAQYNLQKRLYRSYINKKIERRKLEQDTLGESFSRNSKKKWQIKISVGSCGVFVPSPEAEDWMI